MILSRFAFAAVLCTTSLLAGCGIDSAAPDSGPDASGMNDVLVDVSDAGVVHPADASAQVIIADDMPGDGGLLVFAPPLTDASAPLFKVAATLGPLTVSPGAVRVGPDGWTLFVADEGNAGINTFDLPLTPSSVPTRQINSHDSPVDLCFDSKGNLFAAVGTSGIEWWVPPYDTNQESGHLVDGAYNVSAIAIDATDTLYADSNEGSLLVFADPTHQPNPTTFSTGAGFSGLQVEQGKLYALGDVNAFDFYALPLVTGELSTFLYNAPGGAHLSVSPSNEIVAPGTVAMNGQVLMFSPPGYTTISTVVRLGPSHPTQVAFFTPP